MTPTFDGQQEGEKILFEIRPHKLIEQFFQARVVLTAIVFFVILIIIGSQTNAQAAIYTIGTVVEIILLAAGLWWTRGYFRDTRTFLTDRRIMRFERVSPFMVSKRALFWNEAMKAKSYEPNIILQSLKIGTLIIEPEVQNEENVVIHNVYYAGDLANYIDKILFTFKNSPSEIGSIRPFVPKPRGHRG